MKYLMIPMFTLALLASAPANALHGGSDEFLWSVIKESDFCLVYIAGEKQGYEACLGTKDDKIDEMRESGGGEHDDGGDDGGDD